MRKGLSKLFKKTSQKILNKQIKINYICQDSFIGFYRNNEYIPKHSNSNNSENRLFGEEIKPDQNQNIDYIIVIILESPHREEFEFKPYLPAQGVTGVNIKGYLDNLLYKVNECKNKQCSVYLVNSIQYQCSLGQPTKIYRDKMWDALWDKKEFKDDFKLRVQKLNPNMIINLCTDSFDGRRKKVQKILQSIDELKTKVLFFSGNHPSSWRNKRNRYIISENQGNNEKIYF